MTARQPMTGAMIALVPAVQDTARLAIESGEPADQLHLTLWYLGDTASIDDDIRVGLVNAVRSMVQRRSLPQVAAQAFGANLWNPDSDEPSWVLAVGDLPDEQRPDGQERLAAFREMISEAWHDGMVVLDLPPQHTPWQSHICLAYSDDPGLLPAVASRVGPVVFDRVRVAFGDVVVDIPLGKPAAPAAAPATGPIAARTYTRDSDGQFSEMPGGDGIDSPNTDDGAGPAAPPAKDDKLGLAQRITLAPGERLIASADVKQDDQTERDMHIALVETAGGPQIRVGIFTGFSAPTDSGEVDEDGDPILVSEQWSGNSPTDTVRLDDAGLDRMRAEFAQHNAAAKARQVEANAKYEQIEVLEKQFYAAQRAAADRLDPETLIYTAEDKATIAAIQAQLDPLHEWANDFRNDDMLDEGVIPGTAGGGDLAYQVWGNDDGEFSWHFKLAVKPPDTGPGWDFYEATDSGQDIGRMNAGDVARFQRQITSMLAQTAGMATNRGRPARAAADTPPSPGEGSPMAVSKASRRRVPHARAGDPKTWYRVENKAASVADVYIYNDIGCWGLTAADFTKELRDIDASTIELHINSPGGHVFEGIVIFNALRAHRARINVTVDGLAASIASVIAMAGDTITMGRGSQMMIHDAYSEIGGNAKAARDMADLLDRTSDDIASFYAERAGGTAGQWRAVMQAETWYTAEEAVKAGLADQVAASISRERVEAMWDLSIFNFAGRSEAPAPEAVPTVPHRPTPGRVNPVPVFDPAVFRAAVAAAADPMPGFDPDQFRHMLRAAALDAPAVPPPVDPEPVPSIPDQEPAPEPVVGPMPHFDGAEFAATMRGLALDAPAVPDSTPTAVDEEPAPAVPEPESEPDEVAIGGFRPSLFLAALQLAAGSVPAIPDPQPPDPAPADEPVFMIDPESFTRSLREANL